MKHFAILIILLVALTGCTSDEIPTTPILDTPVTEMWVIVQADGTETTYTNEPELWDSDMLAMRPDGSQSTCWHWTFDEGTWWVRHCGYTLSQECFYFQGPTGQLVPCGDLGPGGNW